MSKKNIKDLQGLNIEDTVEDLEDIGENKFLRIVKELLPYAIILIVVVLIRSFVVTPIMVSGDSMNPTFDGGEVLLLNKLDEISRYEIVVANVKDEKIIKRVIAMPGESISCENGVIFVNDKKIEESYGIGITSDFDRVVLGDDEYFVLGDNREDSLDSRKLGPINEKYIKGTTKFVLFPFTKFGNVK